MSSSTPRRKFKIEPIETTTKSSRKFAPQLVQTTTSSSRTADSPDPVQPTPRKRFLPQPIETSTSSRKQKDHGTSKPGSRKFTPQLVETTTERHRQGANAVQIVKEGSRRFTPQLLETTTESRRHLIDSTNIPSITAAVQSAGSSVSDNKARRKFVPQLIDTAKRTRKAGDIRPAHLPSDRTDAMPTDIDRSGRFHLGIVPQASKSPASIHFSPAMTSAEARRLGIPLPKRQYTDCSLRQHSFRVPDLDPIESSESGEESSDSSSPNSPSAEYPYEMYKHATRMRESIDASSSGYLLELAAKAAEKQLREQALAAFPNDDRHNPVNHWIDRDLDENSVMSSRSELDHRRFGSVNWELKDLQKRHEELEKGEGKDTKSKDPRRQRFLPNKGATPWANQFLNNPTSPAAWNKDAEMECMRKKARPPMLGGNIEFPRCNSPEPARFDVTQGSYSVRTAMCYLTEQSENDDCREGLWSPKESNTSYTLWSQPVSRAPSPGGLWAGCCQGSNLTPPRGPTGLLTPRADDEIPNPMENRSTGDMLRQLPPSPPASNSGMASLDEKLELEQSIEEEFSDAFVTQVYNYLSLGYPSLARAFDAELSKIARVPVSELRLDDNLASARGYIRLGEDESGKKDGINEEMCARWKALRLYIYEWARQQSGMTKPQHALGGFGVLARRGSWAW